MRSVLFTWGGRSPVREQTQCLVVAVYRGKLRPRDTPHYALVDRVNSASPHDSWHVSASRPPLEQSPKRRLVYRGKLRHYRAVHPHFSAPPARVCLPLTPFVAVVYRGKPASDFYPTDRPCNQRQVRDRAPMVRRRILSDSPAVHLMDSGWDRPVTAVRVWRSFLTDRLVYRGKPELTRRSPSTCRNSSQYGITVYRGKPHTPRPELVFGLPSRFTAVNREGCGGHPATRTSRHAPTVCCIRPLVEADGDNVFGTFLVYRGKPGRESSEMCADRR